MRRPQYSRPLESLRESDAGLVCSTGGLIHRDLAARNVLVSSYTPAAADQPGAIAVQLTDYGLARDVRMLRGGVYVTPEGSDVAMPKLWIPPESLQSRQFTRASDVRL